MFAHNVETVPRIFKRIRPGFRYERSLDVLRASRSAGLVTKSNLILGMGETRAEISEALRDLHDAGTEIITITQYLRPTPRHHPVERWVKPEEFVELSAEATEIGFVGVMSGPLVRSSYRAGRLYRQAMDSRVTPRCVLADAKAAAKQQKIAAREAKQAEKQRRKTSTNPADMGRLRQIKRAYELTHEYDKWLPLFIWGSWALTIAVFVVIGILTRQVVFLTIMGVLTGLLVAMIILVQRTKKATYKRHLGQAGSAEVALSFLPKQWISSPSSPPRGSATWCTALSVRVAWC